MTTGHDSDGQDEDDDVNYNYCDDNDTFVFYRRDERQKRVDTGTSRDSLGAPLLLRFVC